MEKTITIGNVEVTMRATGNTPKRYREAFNKDLIVEYQRLLKNIDNDGNFTDKADLGVMDRLAWTMAKQANNDTPGIDEWLDQFAPLDIYNAMADILGVWVRSSETLSESKKKAEQ